MKTTILFRKSLSDEDEYNAAKKHFKTIEYRTELKFSCRDCSGRDGNIVIPRYSSLPYYQELEQDVRNMGRSLIQSYKQHKWIADFEYYELLSHLTFKTWTDHNISEAPKDIAYVVKGKTNSRKWQWDTSMFAESREKAIRVGANLYSDSMIGSQGLLYREYVPLKTFEVGINGLPFTNEYRFFFLGTKLIAGGYYWAIAENIPAVIPNGAISFANEVATIASNHTNFYAVDVAEKEGGGWILVELNCGTMSGLSMIDPDYFYSKLSNFF